MKQVCMMVIFIGCIQTSQAQTFREWWRQKQTKIEYLLKQVAALQVYIEYAQEGYKIADRGLQTIGNIKNGEFNLHQDFFGALKGINPKLRNYVKVADIIAMQIRLVRAQKKYLDRVRRSDQFTEKEISYLVRVYTRLLEQSADNVEELTELIAANRYELSDQDRLKRIDALHTEMVDKCVFADWFGGEADLLAANRKKERQETKVVSDLFNAK